MQPLPCQFWTDICKRFSSFQLFQHPVQHLSQADGDHASHALTLYVCSCSILSQNRLCTDHRHSTLQFHSFPSDILRVKILHVLSNYRHSSTPFLSLNRTTSSFFLYEHPAHVTWELLKFFSNHNNWYTQMC